VTEIPLTLEEAAAALRSGRLSSVELTQRCLERADALDGKLGTYLTRFDDAALSTAAQADAELEAGVDRGPLQGIPIAVKDILAVADGPTTAQSLVLDPEWGGGREAPAVQRLRAAGAVILGKTTTMEFACGLPDFSKPFPIPRNPWDRSRWPGGSSSGTGNGIAAGLFLGGLGSDTGGSIRIPAAFCGVTGLMPTFGRVPKTGCVPLGFTLDHIGPLARSAWDCAAMLQVIAGGHVSDPSCVDRPVPDYLAGIDDGISGLRIGVMTDQHFVDPDAGTRAAFDRAVTQFEELGATVTEVSVPYYAEVTAAAMLTTAGESLAFHRNDLRSRWNEYFAATRHILSWGALASAADYVQAQRVRRVGQLALTELFHSVNLVATPTASCGAPTYDTLRAGAVVLRSVHTPYWDAVGNPVIALPMGFTDDGLPVSLQLAAAPFAEQTLLRAGRAFQQATDWHRHTPEMSERTAQTSPSDAALPSVGAGGGDAAHTADEELVTALLAAAELSPPEDERTALVQFYGAIRAMVDAVHGVDAARDETMCLTFRAEAVSAPWDRSERNA
jgi:aspartyl-tRNA(Asn)/glutamyl-tRNA(Gln) amidotransferase subunit A